MPPHLFMACRSTTIPMPHPANKHHPHNDTHTKIANSIDLDKSRRH